MPSDPKIITETEAVPSAPVKKRSIRSRKPRTETLDNRGTLKKGWIRPELAASFAILIILGSVIGYFTYQYYQGKESPEGKEIEALVGKIGKVMELPSDEVPTLATVSDKEKLVSQEFFKRAQNGDQVLIYAKNGRVILYRPSTGKIIDMTSVNMPAPVEAPAAATPPQPPETIAVPEDVNLEAVPVTAKVVLLNGSTRVGVTNGVENRLKTAFPNIEITAKEKASKSDYLGTTIADVSGKNAPLVQSLSDALPGSVASVPSGETIPPGTDIVVIIGNVAQ